jgi:glycosyltransferase involved in cell wall biosynthesis
VLELGKPFFAGHRNVGYWPWELAKWPKEFFEVFEFFDEIWAPTRFIADALRPVSPKPVIHMPPAVVAKPPGIKNRADFGLPENRFLFLYAFDLNSSYHRKNPLAAIEAFQRAFSKGNKQAGLVLKCMYPKTETLQFQHLHALCKADDRIVLLTDTYTRSDILDLFAACDCFVSLHRAEGFGRGIAEAMLLGKPVIATAYSGNLDFCHTNNSCLVAYKEIPIKPEEYWYSEGQVWAEPDVRQAADYMKQLVDDADFRQRIAAAGQAYIAKHHSPEAAGKRYLARFKSVDGA